VAILSAGVGGSAPLLDLTTQEWDRVIGVNLRGAFVCLRECARVMAASAPARGGAIVAVTSISGFLSDRLMAHYAASKAGLAQLVRSAARELGPLGIRVNAVAPGTTDTPMFDATDRLPGYRERVARRAALGRLGTADDVARAAVALCTLEWVTGQVVAADGGVSLHSPIDPQESFEAGA
jgi:NAD(P)-dependent dehydrogenase (short-subunit alcohol dehydrogenase family)